MPTIELVDTHISPDMLDTIGKSFKFRHGNGVAEWLKNSLDHYLRLREKGEEPLPGNWPALIVLIDAPSQKTGPNLAVVDFAGTSLADIQDFFLLWGSRSAATHGGRALSAPVTGGHGNGGKFYMREMWRAGARFLTFRDGRFTSLVVEKRTDGKSGYWEAKGEPGTWRHALDLALPVAEGLPGGKPIIAHLDAEHAALVHDLDAGQRGFTVVVGRKAVQVLSSNDLVRGGKWDQQKLVDAIRDAPQARRPIRELAISVLHDDQAILSRLLPEPIHDDPGWTAFTADVPASVLVDVGRSDKPPTVGRLEIKKAADPLTGPRRDRNALVVMDGRDNPIASYLLRELSFPGRSPVTDFFHGELRLVFAETDQLVQNERERLVACQTTDALLDWAAQEFWARIQAVEEAQRASAKRADLEIASILNDQLNEHAKRFLEQLQTQIYVDVVQDPQGGSGNRTGPGGAGSGAATGTHNPPDGADAGGAGGDREVPGHQQQTRRPRFPQVLLSGYDPDPAADGTQSKRLTDRHPPLDQDDRDREYNVWWINTEHVFAKATLARGGPKGLAFKNFQLHMFRDVVQREALRYRQRREAELSLDRVENELQDISSRFLAELPNDLVADILG